ncbi:acetyl-CoA carboxylase carboxyl transferase subunit alpha, partial [Pseudomonas sp. GP01-A4]
PESCASILWSDSAMAEQAAKVLKLSAPEVKGLGVIDDIVQEPQGGAHRNHQEAAKLLGKSLMKHLQELLKEEGPILAKKRVAKFRKIGSQYI